MVQSNTGVRMAQEETQGGGDAYAKQMNLSWTRSTAEAPVFRPTEDEFRNPVSYIRSIKDKVADFGMCKVVPPYQASTQCFEALRRDAGHAGNIGNLKLVTRQQLIGDREWEDWDEERFWAAPERSLKAFHQSADAAATKVFGTCLLLPPRRVEEEFWRRMAKPAKATSSAFYVEYGDNAEGTGFMDDETDPLGSSSWNLSKFPSVDDSSPLKLLQTPIPGVTTPFMNHGALFSTCSWHVEDQYLLSLHYLHIGAPKTWYAVPAQYAEQFEKVVAEKAYASLCAKMRASGASEQDIKQKVLETLYRKSTVMSPQHLLEESIPVTRTDQSAGEFIITFPRSYHLGFSHGINLGEAVSFALREWYEFGMDAALRMTVLRKSPAIPIDQMACIDMLALTETLKATAEDVTAGHGQQDFRSWLLSSGSSHIAAPCIPLIITFCRVIRWHHRHITKLLQDGLSMHRQAIDISVPCSVTGELMHVAAVMPDSGQEPVSLRQWLQIAPKAAPANSKGILLLHEKWETYRELAQLFGDLCLQQGWGRTDAHAWKAQGLTDRLSLPGCNTDACWEDLTVAYCWQVDDSSPLHSAWSSNDHLPRASDKEGNLLPVFEAVWPDAAVDVPIVAVPVKSLAAGGKRTSNKGARGGKKGGKGAKEAAAAQHSTPPSQHVDAPDTTPNASPPVTTAKSPGPSTPAPDPITATANALSGAPTNVGGTGGATTGNASAGPTPGGAAGGTAGAAAVAAEAEGGPRKRASRASKNAAMASWKANKMLEEDDDDEEDSPSEDGTRQSRRSKKMKREESTPAAPAAGPTAAAAVAKAGPGLAKVYSTGASLVPQEMHNDLSMPGKDASTGSPGMPGAAGQWPPGSAGLPTGLSGGDFPSTSQPNSARNGPQQSQPGNPGGQQQGQGFPGQQQQLGGPAGGGQWGSGPGTAPGPGGALRPRSQNISPITNYPAFHTEQDRWRRQVSEVNNQWVQKLQECAKTNADVQSLLRYYMSLPDVSHVYPVSGGDARMGGPMGSTATAASGGAAPSAGGLPGANGAASVGALQNGSGTLQGSGALSASTLPTMQAGNAQRRTLPGQAGGLAAWPPNSARKESLHNGPISAQDLATSIRGRPTTSDDSRQNGGKPRGVLGGPPSMQAPTGNPAAAAAAAAAAAVHPNANPGTPAGGPSPGEGRGRPGMPGNPPRASGSNMPRNSEQGQAGTGGNMAQDPSGGQVSPNMPNIQPGGGLPTLGMHVMDGQPNSPTLPLTPHSPGDTPRSQLDDIINGTRNSDFHDFLSSLGEHDDADLGMEF